MSGAPALFACSAILLLLTSWTAARRWARTPADSFWVFVAAAAAHLGVVGALVSLFHAYAPVPYLITQAVVCALAGAWFWRWRRGHETALVAELRSWPSQLGRSARATAQDPIAAAMVLALLTFLACSAAEQLLTPVLGVDERAYNCSRVVYWMQWRSFFPYDSHNEGQMDMPFGAELWFGWALLFTRDELVGRAVYWLGFPASVAGVGLVARQIGGGRRATAAAILLFAATPTILFHAGLSQKQDLWTAAYALGAAYWAAKAVRRGEGRPLCWASLFLGIAMSARVTTIAMAPVLGLGAVLPRRGRPLLRRIGALCAGAAAGIMLSTLVFTLAHNLAHYGRPFGTAAMQKVVQPAFSVNQAWTHTVRAALFLLELPEVPSAAARQWLKEAGRRVIPAVGAAPILPGEEHPMWPGRFVYEPRYSAEAYSLGGALWLAGIAGATTLGVRRLAGTWPRPRLPGAVWVMAMSAAMLVEMIYTLRWAGGTWGRYWISAYAVGVPAAVILADRCLARRTWAQAAALLAIVAMAYPSLRGMVWRVELAAVAERPGAQLDEPFEAVTPMLRPGARTLLICSRGSRDYGLFLPRRGYSAVVIPWGKSPSNPARLERMIEEQRVTHVLFERDDGVGFHWDPVVRTAEMVRWMIGRRGFREVPLPVKGMRLFERVGSSRVDLQACKLEYSIVSPK